jgi:hypothetical protein
MNARRHQYMELAQFSSPTNDVNNNIPAAAAVDSSSIAFCIYPTSGRAQGESWRAIKWGDVIMEQQRISINSALMCEGMVYANTMLCLLLLSCAAKSTF